MMVLPNFPVLFLQSLAHLVLRFVTREPSLFPPPLWKIFYRQTVSDAELTKRHWQAQLPVTGGRYRLNKNLVRQLFSAAYWSSVPSLPHDSSGHSPLSWRECFTSTPAACAPSLVSVTSVNFWPARRLTAHSTALGEENTSCGWLWRGWRRQRREKLFFFLNFSSAQFYVRRVSPFRRNDSKGQN